MKQSFKNFAIDLLFPRFCFGCGWEGAYLCSDCRSLLDILEHRYCLCEKPFRLPPDVSRGTCHLCRHKSLSGLHIAVAYQDRPVIKRLIHQFKYEPLVSDVAQTLASLIIEHFVKAGNNTDRFWQNAVLIPVPLDNKKMRARGYNQSELLAKEISAVATVPLLTNLLVKTRETEPQMKLSKEKRQTNLHGAFAVQNPAPIAGKKVFLVDDVYTTGSTMEACSAILRQSGAKSVWGIAVAREG